MVASTLYEKRFGSYFSTPVIVGLEQRGDDWESIVTTYDNIGFKSSEAGYQTCGTGQAIALGVCESYWREGMNKDELFETISQCLLATLDRDSFSGWGANVYIMTPEEITVKQLRTRQD